MTTNDIVIVLGLLERAQDREAALVDGEGEFQRAIAQSRLAAIKAVSEHLKERITAPRPLPDFTRGIQTTPPTVEHRVNDSWFKVEDKLPDPGVEVLAFTINMGGSVEVAYTEKREPPGNHSNWRSPGFTWFKTIKGTAMGDLKVELPCVTCWKPLPIKG